MRWIIDLQKIRRKPRWGQDYEMIECQNYHAITHHLPTSYPPPATPPTPEASDSDSLTLEDSWGGKAGTPIFPGRDPYQPYFCSRGASFYNHIKSR